MPDTTNEVALTTPEVTAEPAATPAPARKPRKNAKTEADKPVKRVPSRSLDELCNVPAKKMTPAESVIYIEAMREHVHCLERKLMATGKNAESAYTMYRNAERAYQLVRCEAMEKLDYAKRLIAVANESIHHISQLETTMNGIPSDIGCCEQKASK